MVKIPGTREEIKAELEATTQKLFAIRGEIRAVKAEAAAKNRYVPLAQYQNMLRQEDGLKTKLISLQAQLAHMPKANKWTLPVAFMQEAQHYLDPIDFENIKVLAEIKMRQQE